MQARLAALSALEVVAFAGALLFFLRKLVRTLEDIGGAPDSHLARIRFGLRAIETQTSHLPKHVRQLNGQFDTLAGQFGVVDGTLASAADAVAKESRPA